MFIFTAGFGGINQLLSLANSYSYAVRQESNARLREQGLLLDGMDIYNSLSSITSAAVGDARAVLDQVKAANPDLPEYKPYTFTPPASMNTAIADAMAGVRDIAAKKAADPNWKGDPTAATLREIEQLELDKAQNEIMANLATNIETLNNNTSGLPDWLQTMSNRINNIQDSLLRMEQSLANQADAAAAAADAAAAAATAATDAATAAGSAATAAEATTTVVNQATTATTTTTTA
jgi:uncharacterized damage-inducible protein DinB